MTHISDKTATQPARRREILQAARAIAAEQGWSAVTVRAVAARIGCSAPAIYQYYRDKDAVLSAIATEGQAALAASLDQAIAELHGPVKRLRALVKAMWNFALSNRELYAVMFGLDGLTPHAIVPSDGLAPEALRRVASDIAEKRATGRPDDLADRVAATVHGFLCLAVTDVFPGGHDRALTLLLEVLDALVKQPDRR